MSLLNISLNKKKTGFILSFFLLLIAVLLYIHYLNRGKPQQMVEDFQHSFLHKEKLLKSEMDLTKKTLSNPKQESLFSHKGKDFYTTGMEILVYQNDSLIHWSDNKIPVPSNYERSFLSSKFQKLSNAAYYINQEKYNEFRIVGILLIKNEYSYQNKYLKSGYIRDFNLPTSCQLSSKKQNGYPVFNAENEYIFSIQKPLYGNINSSQANLIFLIAILFYILFLFSVIEDFLRRKKRIRYKWLFFGLFIIITIAIRAIFFFLSQHFLKDSTPLLSPVYYASSSFLPSYGDLLINAVSLFYLALAYFRLFDIKKNSIDNPKKLQLLFVFFGGVILTIINSILFDIIRGMIINSRISLDLNNLPSLSFYSAVGFLIIGILIIALFLLVSRLLSVLSHYSKDIRTMVFTLIPSYFLLYILPFNWNIQIFGGISLLLAYVGYWIFMKKSNKELSFSFLIYFLIVYSAAITLTLQDNIALKEHEQRKILATQLSISSNPMAEYSFTNIEDNIKTDTTLTRLLQKYDMQIDNQDEITQYLRKKYFKGLWGRFNVLFNVCPQEFNLNMQPGNYIINCQEYYDDLIKDMGKATPAKHLFLVKETSGNPYYIARFEFFNNSDEYPRTMLYIEMYASFVPEGIGYPELLIDDAMYNFPNISDYSYARYQDNNLVYKYGNYFYKLKLSDKIFKERKDGFYTENEYSHYVDHNGPDSEIILSKKAKSFLDWIAPFSYLFLFFALLSLIFLGFNWAINQNKPFSFSLSNRLQIALLVIILASFLFVGISTVFYITNLNNQKNIEILKEKTHSVQIELEHKFNTPHGMNLMNQENLENLLTKFRSVFFTDINLYDLNGNLLATSLPAVFQKGLISYQINPEAYDQLKYKHDFLFIEKERIGAHRYLSAYVTFTDTKGDPIAILNLPYFARQGEIGKEIGGFLIAYINIYVILTAIAVILAIFFARYITRPLLMIREKLKDISLNHKNEKIEWKQEDEIGSLVKEYNRMIDELSMSAEKLARSERESAWREMARQVAHEIKNPLTPMKLSVQYLKKAWDDKAPDWDNRLNRFSQTLIEQIDTLSSIATAFSNFAKMPIGKPERFEIVTAIHSAADLFVEHKDIEFSWKTDTKEEVYIHADSSQIIRVFNNLFKNAIQAIPKDVKGQITITLEKKGRYCLIKVKDNGRGIPQDQREKIFTPNFTTKTSGMGLGLAMVKNIIQSAQGNIWFESEIGKGTIFYLEFPIYEL
ncbi:MAG: ATP-binding protein [Bacteroidales bacterium]